MGLEKRLNEMVENKSWDDFTLVDFKKVAAIIVCSGSIHRGLRQRYNSLLEGVCEYNFERAEDGLALYFNSSDFLISESEILKRIGRNLSLLNKCLKLYYEFNGSDNNLSFGHMPIKEFLGETIDLQRKYYFAIEFPENFEILVNEDVNNQYFSEYIREINREFEKEMNERWSLSS
ncbi:MAG: hypothetical protein ACOCXG_00460 [Nanoarchaeota archaeon]